MTQEGQRHAAELKRLEDRKKELEDALGRLARDEADAEEVMELATLVEQLEQHVETARAAADMENTMTKNDQHLAHMGAKQRRLYDALVNAADEEADAIYAQLADKLNLPKIDVALSERPASTVTEKTTAQDVQKAAAANRQAAEQQLDELAKQMQQPGESFHKAYDRALNTDMGKALMQSRDDAQELERGGVTSMELEEARKSLAR